MTKNYIFSFQHHHHIHYTVMMKKKLLFLLLLIATTSTTSWLCRKNIYPIAATSTTSWLCWKSIFPIATPFTTPWSREKQMSSFQHYLYYILVITKNIIFFISEFLWKKNPIATFVIMTIFFSLFLHSLRCD